MWADDRGKRWFVGASSRGLGSRRRRLKPGNVDTGPRSVENGRRREQASWADARGKRWFVGASRKGKPNGKCAAYTRHHAGEEKTAASSRANVVTATITAVTIADDTTCGHNSSANDATDASCAAAATNTNVDVVVLTFYEEVSRPGSACFDEAPIVDESVHERRKNWLGDRKEEDPAAGPGLAT